MILLQSRVKYEDGKYGKWEPSDPDGILTGPIKKVLDKEIVGVTLTISSPRGWKNQFRLVKDDT